VKLKLGSVGREREVGKASAACRAWRPGRLPLAVQYGSAPVRQPAIPAGERTNWMASTKRQTTMAKMAREQAVRERRVRKQQKKDDRKLAAAALGGAPASLFSAHDANDESPGVA
jgi:hypothetical protein